MNATEILNQARDTMAVKRVFGDPIERDGVTIVPVARVMGGAGFGSGTAPTAGGPEGEAEGGAAPTGEGGGFGVAAGPAGVYVIKDGSVTWQPTIQPERIVLVAGFTAFLILFGVRMVIRAFRR
jgi:uncharacterized spore protein YtfJ